jgi:ATP-dependent Clp protease ATP-binding subunit ClpC
MFERYTEKARRVIFFARYEALQHGTGEIDTPCLLLGILREDKDLMSRLLTAGEFPPLPAVCEELARLSAEAEALLPKTAEKIATNVDMPLSAAASQALAYAAEEAWRLGHKHIDPRHLLLGLLRTDGPETKCLLAHGIGLEKVRAEPFQGVNPDHHEPRQVLDRARDYTGLFWTLLSMPEDRREAAATLLEGLASGKFEATGTSHKGPFHFSFEDKEE